MNEPTHTPTCEVNRGGDHGPCSCGRDAEARRERLASLTADDIIYTISAWWEARDARRNGAALQHGLDVTDAIRSLTRQRDALRQAAELVTRGGDARCLRAALEVR